MESRASGSASGMALLHHLCSWPRCSKATSVSTKSTTTEAGTTSATCSAWPASSVAAATGRRVEGKSAQQVPDNGQVKLGLVSSCSSWPSVGLEFETWSKVSLYVVDNKNQKEV